MLALEKGRVIVGCGIAAYFSVLSGKRHQGRTAQRAGEPLYRTALGGGCQFYYSTSRTSQSAENCPIQDDPETGLDSNTR
jgi:hypothetical protein